MARTGEQQQHQQHQHQHQHQVTLLPASGRSVPQQLRGSRAVLALRAGRPSLQWRLGDAVANGVEASNQANTFGISLAEHTALGARAAVQLPPAAGHLAEASPAAKRRRSWQQPTGALASLSLAWDFFRGHGGLRTAISQAYAQLDVDQSGSLSQEDLEAYALRNGLPTAYIAQFMNAVYDHEQQRSQRRQQQQQQQQQSTVGPPESAACEEAAAARGCGSSAASVATSCLVQALDVAQASCASVGALDVTDTSSMAAASALASSAPLCSSATRAAHAAVPAGSAQGDGAPACATPLPLTQPAPNPLAALLAAALKLGSPGSSGGVLGVAAAGGAGEGINQTSAPTAARELTYSMFDRFVRTREVALRKAFDMFDRDRDGVISVDDLEASLAHISICCPRSRCVYRCPRELAHAMLQRTHLASPSSVSSGAASGGGSGVGSESEEGGGSVDFAGFRRFFMLLPETELAVEYWLKAGTLPLLTEKLSAVHEGSEPGPKAAAWGHLFAGAVAGAASRTATAPLETLRLAVMTGSLQGDNLMQAASSIVEAQGWKGLFRGNALNVLRSAPQKALDFFAFDAFKRLLMGQDSAGQVAGEGRDGTALKTFVAAGLAGMTSWAVLYPLETVRSRVTAGLTPAGTGVAAVARSIVQREGVGALYKGLGWSLAGIFPEAALCYGLHDLLKLCYRNAHHGQEPGVVPSLAFGVVSAFTGQLVAFPLETVARRLQVYQGPGGLPTMLTDMFKQGGGPRVLYRGVGAATLRLIPMAMVSFGTYEVVRSLLLALEASHEEVKAESDYATLHSFREPLTNTLTGASTIVAAAGKRGTQAVARGGAAAAVAADGASEGGTLALEGLLPECARTSLVPAPCISTHTCAELVLHGRKMQRRHSGRSSCLISALPAGGAAAAPLAAMSSSSCSAAS